MAPSAARVRAPRRNRFPWTRWSDEELLDVRMCDLGVEIKGTVLEERIAQLHEELEARDLRLRPHFWLSEEWFCPDGIPGIAIPFYLAHPRLVKLERKQMLEVEGLNRSWCMKIMRHEAGHAMQNAFNLHRRKRYRDLFGRASQKYPDSYQPRPKSKNYVLNLYVWYGQSHPAEDFAETFAVWLRPRSLWRKRYQGWQALEKLEYVDELMHSIAGKPPVVRSRKRVDPITGIKRTLRQYYEAKQEHHGIGFPTVYDRDLKRLFSDDPRHRNREMASAFLRRNRREIRRAVATWTGEYQYTLDEVFREVIGRCRELGLRVVGSERQLKLDFAIFLTVRAMHYLHNSRGHHPL